MKIIEPLYMQSGGLSGFRCTVDWSKCHKLTFTFSGAIRHLRRVHGIELQMTFDEALRKVLDKDSASVLGIAQHEKQDA